MKVASSFCDITPNQKTTLGCNEHIEQPFNDIDSSLELNAIRLNKGEVDTFIISVDTLFVTNEIKQYIVDYLNEQIMIQPEHVFLCASHTHYAPFLDPEKPNLGALDKNYEIFFKKQLHTLLDELMSKPLTDVDIVFNESITSDIAVSRRKKSWGFWKRIILRKWMRLFPNREEPIDTKIRTFKLVKKNSHYVMAIMWNFACHPVMYHSQLNVSSHFPGDIRTKIRDKNQGIPVVFLQGFSGDIRPLNTEKPITYKEKILARLNQENEFKSFTKDSYSTWVNKLNEQVVNCLSKGEILNSKLKIRIMKFNQDEILAHGQGDIYMHFIELSDKHLILGVSAEVVSSYAMKLQQSYPEKKIVPVGCMGSVFGYWPSSKMLNEGGYEVVGFKSKFGLNAKFKSKALENVFFKHTKQILK
ncbi:MAG: hypothetical protein VW397_05585 [Candidatus Margulisiibacteriota bacterium]